GSITSAYSFPTAGFSTTAGSITSAYSFPSAGSFPSVSSFPSARYRTNFRAIAASRCPIGKVSSSSTVMAFTAKIRTA
ncbi:hypothetical protein SAMN04487889_1111, partial [Eubacterium pyruvativorans]